jgi:hypothetical protein
MHSPSDVDQALLLRAPWKAGLSLCTELVEQGYANFDRGRGWFLTDKGRARVQELEGKVFWTGQIANELNQMTPAQAGEIIAENKKRKERVFARSKVRSGSSEGQAA